MLFEAEGYRPPTITKMLENEVLSSVDRELLSFYYK